MTIWGKACVRAIKENAEGKEGSKYLSKRISFWEMAIAIAFGLLTIVFGVLPLVFDNSSLADKTKIIIYGILASIFLIFELIAYIIVYYYKTAREECVAKEKEEELSKNRDEKKEEDFCYKLETFVLIGQDIVTSQREGRITYKRFAGIITKHVFDECERKYGKGISVAFYDMKPTDEIGLLCFLKRDSNIDTPEFYQKGYVKKDDPMIADRFFTFCLTDKNERIFDLPNHEAIMKAFDFRVQASEKKRKSRKRKKEYSFKQYISFTIDTADKHKLLIEVISHHQTDLGNEEELRSIAADLSWRYEMLIQSYWDFLTEERGEE